MSDLAVRQGAGRVLVDRLEQGRSPNPAVDNRRSTLRSFEESVERVRRPGARHANRPRAGAMVATCTICLLVAGAVAIGPVFSSGLKQRPSAAQRANGSSAGTGTARLAAQAVAPGTSVGAAPSGLARTGQGPGAVGNASPSSTAPVAAAAVVPHPAGSPQVSVVASTGVGSAPSAQRAAPVSNPSPLPAVTFSNVEVEGLGAGRYFATRGPWTRKAGGGYPGFRGPVLTTSSSSAWADWSLGYPAGGQRWDQVRVRIWIPNATAGAWVRYRVTTTNAGVTSVRNFDVPQQPNSGWYTLGAFSVGTATQRRGSIWVHLTYIGPYTGQGASSCPGGGCVTMAAAVVELAWS